MITVEHLFLWRTVFLIVVCVLQFSQVVFLQLIPGFPVGEAEKNNLKQSWNCSNLTVAQQMEF